MADLLGERFVVVEDHGVPNQVFLFKIVTNAVTASASPDLWTLSVLLFYKM